MPSNKNPIEYHATVQLPIGRVGVIAPQDHLIGIEFIAPDSEMIKPKTTTAKETVLQLQCYFADPNFNFDVPIQLSGISEFQQQVLQAMQKIPVGETRTYADLATALKSHARAIGGACRYNPIPLIIPCHRIVAKTNLGGYMGETKGPNLRIKKWLLKHESAPIS